APAIPDLARQPVPGRSQPVLRAQPARARRGAGAFPGDPHPCRRRTAALLGLRPAGRHRLRGPPVRLDRPHRHPAGADRHIDAVLIRRPAPDPVIGGGSALLPGQRLVRDLWRRRSARPALSSRHAGGDAGGRRNRRHRAAHPHRHARGAAAGLYPHRPRQGAERAPRHLPPRLQGRSCQRYPRHRHSGRLRARRRGLYRDGLPVAGHRRHAGQCHLHPRHPAGAGRRAGGRGQLRAVQPRRRRRPVDARSEAETMSVASAPASPARGSGRPDAVRLMLNNRLATAGLAILAFMAALALLAPLLPLAGPDATAPAQRLLRPLSEGHLLGTDALGRDIFSRIVWGLRVSLAVGISATLIAAFFGSLVGLVAGYAGGRTDNLLMRGIDMLMAFPYILLALAIVAVLGPGLINALYALAVVNFPFFARNIRGVTLGLARREFVDTARLSGKSHLSILATEILPNVAPVIVITMSTTVGWMI